jgi:hypothetical protein
MALHGEHNPGDNASASPLSACIRFVLGRQLANREIQAREIGAAEGVPAIGLDGLSSTAYGPEAALTVLSAAGAAGLAYLGPVMLTILALLGILFISYWQTIEAYPKSGGAYTVSQANLGVNASLLAAAALMMITSSTLRSVYPRALQRWFRRCRLCMYIRCRFALAFLSSSRSSIYAGPSMPDGYLRFRPTCSSPVSWPCLRLAIMSRSQAAAIRNQ